VDANRHTQHLSHLCDHSLRPRCRHIVCIGGHTAPFDLRSFQNLKHLTIARLSTSQQHKLIHLLRTHGVAQNDKIEPFCLEKLPRFGYVRRDHSRIASPEYGRSCTEKVRILSNSENRAHSVPPGEPGLWRGRDARACTEGYGGESTRRQALCLSDNITLLSSTQTSHTADASILLNF
jgi:hypothetical protein